MTLGVIGSNGRLAGELIRLASSDQISLRLSSSKFSSNSTFIDLSQRLMLNDLDDAFSDVESLVYLASTMDEKTTFLNKDSKTYLINVENLSIVAKWSRVNKKHLIYISGGIVYKDIHSNGILEISEIGLNDFGGVYGESKYLGEIEIEKEVLEGLEACLIRPSSIYGGYKLKSGMIENFISAALKDKRIEVHPPFEQIIGFVHAHDVATSILFAYNNELKGAFNVSQSKNISVLKICEIISGITGCSLILKSDNQNGSVKDLDRYKLSSDKIKELGWSEYYNIETGIQQCVNAFI
jgi:nucleoside-diphosphate-sugar epimerase